MNKSEIDVNFEAYLRIFFGLSLASYWSRLKNVLD